LQDLMEVMQKDCKWRFFRTIPAEGIRVNIYITRTKKDRLLIKKSMFIDDERK